MQDMKPGSWQENEGVWESHLAALRKNPALSADANVVIYPKRLEIRCGQT
jgi:hypothetical protein